MAEPIRSVVNQYQGINAHLYSLLQTPGSDEVGPSMWPSFHSDHITNISEFLNRVLPQRYIARTEQSLQIRIQDIPGDPPLRYSPEPDVTIYRQASEAGGSSALRQAAEAAATALEQTLDLSEDFIPSTIIRDMSAHGVLGQPVARIELLSPANKPGRVGYEYYRRSRNTALYTGVPLIELDYLHETPPPVMRYPIYPKQKDAHPYVIFISDPRPSVQEGYCYAYGFDIDAKFPAVNIPLAGDEVISFDFGVVYKYTFENGRWGNFVDYSQLPARFHTYSQVDQTRIQQRMKTIANAHTRGLDLEQGPFPLVSD